METPTPIPWLTPERRAYLYYVAIAVLGVLTAYDVVNDGQVSVWTTVIGAVLGISGLGVASAHVPRSNAGKHEQ